MAELLAAADLAAGAIDVPTPLTSPETCPDHHNRTYFCTFLSNPLLIQSRTRTDRKRALRILKLVEAILRDPFGGIGKPEPLRRELAGRWSRRSDIEHRLVYQVADDRV